MRKLQQMMLGAFIVAGGTVVLPASAAAQQQACVALKAGSGYAARMRVTTGGTSTGWTSSFPVGQERCINLTTITALRPGDPFSVEVQAVAGRTVTCAPANVPYNPNMPANLVYIATGTTQNVHCKQPG
jgi:hypothetical protein